MTSSFTIYNNGIFIITHHIALVRQSIPVYLLSYSCYAGLGPASIMSHIIIVRQNSEQIRVNDATYRIFMLSICPDSNIFRTTHAFAA